ncbi:class I SAM-dependent methyltransferase [Paenibacillus spiritus]|uniref:Class I SAM-dependent methyltransferase n=1 Tax=Paenibacillus spiritus TaxID=2496557 RepID=A0A5J5FS42_9BACL|nr:MULTISPECIES: class I SAM-dependent methyltransferase [Paenibacillus]KAA8995405.1 class I SAM-dependent methyltransferase [Paenibacillus spiritus]
MYREIVVQDFLPLFLEQLKFCDSILDIGCGTGVLLERYQASLVIALEIHRPYLENRQFEAPHIIPVNANAADIGRLFLPRTFSAVTFVDSLEHFPKEEGMRLLEAAAALARSRVVVFTPRGYFPQSNTDYYHLKGEIYQEHRSGWEVEDFLRLGFEVTVLKGFHTASNLAFLDSFGAEHPPVDAILASREVLT